MLTDWSEIKTSGKEPYPEQGLVPGHSGMKWVSARILFVHSGSKAAANSDLSSTLGGYTVGGLGSEARFQVKKSACF